MPKVRLQSTQRKARRATGGSPQHRFLGVSLAGGKTDKACIAVVDYYIEQKKMFLARLFEKIKSEPPLISADYKIHEILSEYETQSELIAYDVPLTLPKCVTCQLKCPGYETCNEPEIKWFRSFYEKFNKNKKPKRMFTPYTQRPIETYLSQGLEEPFDLQHTMGANLAPLMVRAQFIQRRLKIKAIEVQPKITVWRLGQHLKVNKSDLRFYRHAVGGDESRKEFLNALSEKGRVFIYHQDFKHMVENNHAFEAFICAYTAFLSYTGETEKRPEDFPKDESWAEFPKI